MVLNNVILSTPIVCIVLVIINICLSVINISMDLQEVGCGYMDWIGLAQDRESWWTPVSAVMNRRVP